MIKLMDSIEIQASAHDGYAKLVEYLSGRESYQAWHPEHVNLRWRGEPMRVGSILDIEERLQGHLHRLKFRITKVVPDELVAYRPLFPLALIATGNTFRFDAIDEKTCTFSASGCIRFPMWLFKRVSRNHEGKLLASKQHMKEEGERLRAAVEHDGAPC